MGVQQHFYYEIMSTGFLHPTAFDSLDRVRAPSSCLCAYISIGSIHSVLRLPCNACDFFVLPTGYIQKTNFQLFVPIYNGQEVTPAVLHFLLWLLHRILTYIYMHAMLV